MHRLGVTAALLAFSLFAAPANAATEIYSITGTGSGTLNGVSFTDTAFRFTLTGDPATLSILGLTSQIDPLTTAVASITGIGAVTFGLPTRLGENNTIIYFGRSAGFDLFDFALASHVDLVSTFGPIPGTGVTALNQFVDVPTSGGNLTFTRSSNVLFSGLRSEIVPSVPEPGTWIMMLVGFGAVGHSVRRRATALQLRAV